MKNNRKEFFNNVLMIGLAVLVVAFGVLSIINKQKLANYRDLQNYHQSLLYQFSINDSLLLLQMEFQNIQVDTSLILVSPKGKSNSIGNLTKDGVLVFRFFSETCLTCFDQNIQVLKKLLRGHKLPTIIITNTGSINALKKLQTSLKVPIERIYMIKQMNEQLIDYDDYLKPYYSWIDFSGVTRDFYIIRQGKPEITQSYLTILEDKLTKTVSK